MMDSMALPASCRIDLGGSIVVTGGASGIGLACVDELLGRGCQVAAVDRQLTPALQALCLRHGDNLLYAECDVTDPAQVADAGARIRDVYGKIGGLACSAGIMSGKDLLDTDMDLWRRVFAVNVEGAVLWMQQVLPGMVEAGKGAIVLFSSQLTNSGGRNNAAYITAKGALRSLGKTAALEHAIHNVRINTVLPGATDTPMLNNGARRFDDPEAALARSRARHAMGRFATAQEVAGCVAFLLSNAAAFMTGAEVLCDGGWSVQ